MYNCYRCDNRYSVPLSLAYFWTPNYSYQKLGNFPWHHYLLPPTFNPSPKLLTRYLNVSQIHLLHFHFHHLTITCLLPGLLCQPPKLVSPHLFNLLQAIFHRKEDNNFFLRQKRSYPSPSSHPSSCPTGSLSAFWLTSWALSHSTLSQSFYTSLAGSPLCLWSILCASESWQIL